MNKLVHQLSSRNGVFKGLVTAASEQGWTVDTTRNNHIRFVAPDGQRIHAGSTPSDRRAVLNLRARLRRAGLRL